MSESRCELCGEPMPPGEEMFKYHGSSGSCPKPPLSVADTQQLLGAERPISIGKVIPTDPIGMRTIPAIVTSPPPPASGETPEQIGSALRSESEQVLAMFGVDAPQLVMGCVVHLVRNRLLAYIDKLHRDQTLLTQTLDQDRQTIASLREESEQWHERFNRQRYLADLATDNQARWMKRVEAAEAQVQQLTEDCQRLERRVADLCDAHEEQHVRADQAEEERDRLREALQTYGQHQDGCVFSPQVLASTRPKVCTCGFADALLVSGDGETPIRS